MGVNTKKYSDAIGYLDDLVSDVNLPWFHLLRDIAVMTDSSVLDQPTLEQVIKVFWGDLENTPSITSKSLVTLVSSPTISSDFLEQLSSFSNFKLLSDTLLVDFKKQITLIFGTNGSGKSSLCESFKILANPKKPSRPLRNLRSSISIPSSFSYKLKSNTTNQVWTPTCGYGLKSECIKYFDTSVAALNATVAVEPGRVITVTPFRLGVFESIKTLTNLVRETLKEKNYENYEILKKRLSELTIEYCDYKDSPLSSINIDTISTLAGEIAKAEALNDQKALADKQSAVCDLEKATSEEGIKSLRLELRDLENIVKELKILADSAESLWFINPIEKLKLLGDKNIEQNALADALIPKGVTLDKLMALLKSASGISAFDKSLEQVCPLCRRSLEESQIELFKQYHELLNGQLESEITKLKEDLNSATQLCKAINAICIDDWDNFVTLSGNNIDDAKTFSKKILSVCNLETVPTVEARQALVSLRELIQTLSGFQVLKLQSIETSTKGREGILQQLEELRLQIKPLAYLDSIHKNLEKLRDIQQMIDSQKKLDSALAVFTPLLTKITIMAKTAHEDLIVNDFESKLNQEYRNLTEKEMKSFGVKLKRVGSDASVTVKPQVGGSDIFEVLSEGELRVHSLALFFAEIECNCCSVLVFDDPISSFDYNFIENFCIRLRDFAISHPSCQIIVLTHNWEFFVQLQTKFNGGGLDSKLSVQVLENSSIVSEYSENVNELKRDITSILVQPNEPSKQQKEEMAGKMRRLIEVVVNTHVFNGQRHQYKQKSQSVSVFQKYTNVTPLTQTEATELTDLYSKLSISEHDDPRTAFVNTDKATFQSRFDRIGSIETAIIFRKAI